jgi:hypothetical protein
MAEPLTLCATFSGGIGTLEVGPDHPLIGPWRVAILEGRPTGQWFWFAVHDQLKGACRVLGSFVHTPGDRLLYFPGAAVSIHADGEQLARSHMDHITLDPPTPKGRHRSHVALSEGSRGNKYGSRPPQGHLQPWFSLLTPNLDNFTTMPAELRVSFPPPRPDVQNFARDLLKGPGLRVIPLPPGGPDAFLQMDVWVGRVSDWQSLRARPLSWPYKREIVLDAPSDSQRVDVIEQNVEFATSVGLRILCLRPRGRLAGAHILRPTVEYLLNVA